MAHDEAAAGLLHHVTDTHLADRARLGDAVAFDELVRRHAATVARFATVVSGDAELSTEVTTRAFTDVFDQIGSGGYSIEDPFLPGLLRSARDLARLRVAPAAEGTGPAGVADLSTAAERAVWRLDEDARSAHWLRTDQGLDDHDLGLTLDRPATEAGELADAAAARLGKRRRGADLALAALAADLPPWTADEARTTWRAWVATVDGAEESTPARARRPLAARLEPLGTRVLRGAAVVLLLAGGAGMLADEGGPGLPGRTSTGAEEVAGSETGSGSEAGTGGRATDDGPTASGRRIGAPDLGGEIELSGTTAGSGRSGAGGPSRSGAAPRTRSTTGTTAGGASGSGASTGTTSSATVGGSSTGGSGSTAAPGSPSTGSPSAPTPSGPTPSSPSPSPGPSAPTPAPSPSPAPAPSTPAPAPAPPAPAPAPNPPPAPPAPTAPAPSTPTGPITTVVDTVTDLVTTVGGGLGGLLGGGR